MTYRRLLVTDDALIDAVTHAAKVQYANSNNIPFYTKSRGHALTTSVGLFNGIVIDIASLDSIYINPGNTSAHIQGGVFSQVAIESLWDQGYVTGKFQILRQA